MKFLDDLDDYKVFKAHSVYNEIYRAIFAEYWRIILKWILEKYFGIM